MAKILLVEDDNNLREIYEARLQAEGYDIVSAQDGEDALVKAKQEKPDLVISDVMMPRISGFEMLDILRNTEGLKDAKVIMLTALGQAEDKTRADALGADRYLVKSQVTLEDIVHAADELLNGGQAPADSTTTTAAPSTPSPTTVTEPAPAAVPPTTASIPVQAPPSPAPAAQPVAPTQPVATPTIPVVAPPAAPATATATASTEPVAPDTVQPTATDTAAQSSQVAPASSDNPPVQATQTATTQPAVAEPAKPVAPATEPVAATTAAPITEPIEPAKPVVEAQPATAAPASATSPESSVAADDKLIADAVKQLTGEPTANDSTAPTATKQTASPDLPEQKPTETVAAPTAEVVNPAPQTVQPTEQPAPAVAEPAKPVAPATEPVAATTAAPITEPIEPAKPVVEAQPATEETSEKTTDPAIAGAQSAADEQAIMQKQIDDFIQQQDATDKVSPAATANPVVEPAADTVVTAPSPTPTETVAATTAEVVNPAPQTVQPTEQPAPAVAEESSENDADNVNIAHKKVIQPPVQQLNPQPDLNELLAKEGINNLDDHAATPHANNTPFTPPHAPGHVIAPSGQPSSAPQAPAADDPNNIAL